MQQVPNDTHERRAAPLKIRNSAGMLSNLLFCGTCIWVLIQVLFSATEIEIFRRGGLVLAGIQLLIAVSLYSTLRGSRDWAAMPKRVFYRAALCVGMVPVGISGGLILVGVISALLSS